MTDGDSMTDDAARAAPGGAERTDRIRREHRRVQGSLTAWCDRDSQTWPCDAVWLLDRYAAGAADRDGRDRRIETAALALMDEWHEPFVLMGDEIVCQVCGRPSERVKSVGHYPECAWDRLRAALTPPGARAGGGEP